MKPFEAQSYYELLEVSVSATTAEIEAAFVRLSRLYGDDQMSLYGLVEPQRARELKDRLDEARQVLTNDALRAEYDKRIGLPPRAPPPADPSPVGPLGFEGLLPSPPGNTATLSVSALNLRGARTSSGEALPAQVTSRVEPPREAAATTVAPPREVAPPSASPAPAPASSGPRWPALSPPQASPAPAPEPQAPAAALPSAPPEAQPAPEVAAPPVSPAPPPDALAVVPQKSEPPPESRPKAVEIPDGAVFNGALLKRVREARGLTLQVISDRTRIGVRHLENLEADRYQQLPAMVYLRGMLMSLSRELGIDGLKVSRSYLELVEQAKG